MRTVPSIRGLYAVTPDSVDTALLVKQVSAAIEGGATLVQYRNKAADAPLLLEQATALLALCRYHAIPLIVNDHLELCLTIDADGLHLGGTDGNIDAARRRLGHDKLLGVSCYDRMELAMQARQAGADYVAFGSCFDSGTKPAAPRAPLELLGKARRLGIAVVAIGGITAENAALAIAAGADAIAIIGALWMVPDVRRAARTFSNFFLQNNDHDYTQPATV